METSFQSIHKHVSDLKQLKKQIENMDENIQQCVAKQKELAEQRKKIANYYFAKDEKDWNVILPVYNNNRPQFVVQHDYFENNVQTDSSMSTKIQYQAQIFVPVVFQPSVYNAIIHGTTDFSLKTLFEKLHLFYEVEYDQYKRNRFHRPDMNYVTIFENENFCEWLKKIENEYKFQTIQLNKNDSQNNSNDNQLKTSFLFLNHPNKETFTVTHDNFLNLQMEIKVYYIPYLISEKLILNNPNQVSDHEMSKLSGIISELNKKLVIEISRHMENGSVQRHELQLFLHIPKGYVAQHFEVNIDDQSNYQKNTLKKHTPVAIIPRTNPMFELDVMFLNFFLIKSLTQERYNGIEHVVYHKDEFCEFHLMKTSSKMIGVWIDTVQTRKVIRWVSDQDVIDLQKSKQYFSSKTPLITTKNLRDQKQTKHVHAPASQEQTTRWVIRHWTMPLNSSLMEENKDFYWQTPTKIHVDQKHFETSLFFLKTEQVQENELWYSKLSHAVTIPINPFEIFKTQDAKTWIHVNTTNGNVRRICRAWESIHSKEILFIQDSKVCIYDTEKKSVETTNVSLGNYVFFWDLSIYQIFFKNDLTDCDIHNITSKVHCYYSYDNNLAQFMRFEGHMYYLLHNNFWHIEEFENFGEFCKTPDGLRWYKDRDQILEIIEPDEYNGTLGKYSGFCKDPKNNMWIYIDQNMNPLRFSIVDITKEWATPDKKKWMYDPASQTFSEKIETPESFFFEDYNIKSKVMEINQGIEFEIESNLVKGLETIENVWILERLTSTNEPYSLSNEQKSVKLIQKGNVWELDITESGQTITFFAVENSNDSVDQYAVSRRNNIYGVYQNMEWGTLVLQAKKNHATQFFPTEHISAVYNLVKKTFICIRLSCVLTHQLSNFQKQYIDYVYYLTPLIEIGKYLKFSFKDQQDKAEVWLTLNHDLNLWVLELYDQETQKYKKYCSQYEAADWHDGTTLYQNYVDYHETRDITKTVQWMIKPSNALDIKKIQDFKERKKVSARVKTKDNYNDVFMLVDQHNFGEMVDDQLREVDDELKQWGDLPIDTTRLEDESIYDKYWQPGMDTFSKKFIERLIEILENSSKKESKGQIWLYRNSNKWLQFLNLKKTNTSKNKDKNSNMGNRDDDDVKTQEIISEIQGNVIQNENESFIFNKMVIKWSVSDGIFMELLNVSDDKLTLFPLNNDKDTQKLFVKNIPTVKISFLGEFELKENDNTNLKKNFEANVFKLVYCPNPDEVRLDIDYFGTYFSKAIRDTLNETTLSLKFHTRNSQKHYFFSKEENDPILNKYNDVIITQTEKVFFNLELGMSYYFQDSNYDVLLHMGIVSRAWILKLENKILIACLENGLFDSRSSPYGYFRFQNKNHPCLKLHNERDFDVNENRLTEELSRRLEPQQNLSDTHTNQNKIIFPPYWEPKCGLLIPNFNVYDEKTIPKTIEINCLDEDTLLLRNRTRYPDCLQTQDDYLISGTYLFRGVDKDTGRQSTNKSRIIRINYERQRKIPKPKYSDLTDEQEKWLLNNYEIQKKRIEEENQKELQKIQNETRNERAKATRAGQVAGNFKEDKRPLLKKIPDKKECVVSNLENNVSTFLSLSFKTAQDGKRGERGWKFTKWKDTWARYTSNKTFSNKEFSSKEKWNMILQKGLMLMKKSDYSPDSIGGYYQINAQPPYESVKVFISPSVETKIQHRFHFEVKIEDDDTDFADLEWSGVYSQLTNHKNPYYKVDQTKNRHFEIRFNSHGMITATCYENFSKTTQRILVQYFRISSTSMIGIYQRENDVKQIVGKMTISNISHAYHVAIRKPNTSSLQVVPMCGADFDTQKINRVPLILSNTNNFGSILSGFFKKNKKKESETDTDNADEFASDTIDFSFQKNSQSKMVQLPNLKIKIPSMIVPGPRRQKMQTKDKMKMLLKFIDDMDPSVFQA